MSIQFNPNSASPTPGMRGPILIDLNHNTARSTSFSGSSSLSSLAQEGGERDEAVAEELKPKVSADEAGSIGCWDIVTAPFRAVAYLVNSLWTCLCGKKEEVKAIEDDVPAKPVRAASSEFDRALKARGDAAVDSEELGEIFQRLPSTQQKKYDDFLWFLSDKAESRKDFERTVGNLDDEGKKSLRMAKDAHSRLNGFTSFVTEQKIKELADDDQLTAKAKAYKKFDKLANGHEDEVGGMAKRELVNAALILRGLDPAEGDEVTIAQQQAALGDFDGPLKTAIKCLVHNNMMLLGTQKARDSIRDFVKAVSSDDQVSAERIRQQYKTLDKEAADLLSLAASHAKDQPRNKALVSECVTPDARGVLHIATLISTHDNGKAHNGFVERGGARGHDADADGRAQWPRRRPASNGSDGGSFTG